jgi:PAS domain-containing protein
VASCKFDPVAGFKDNKLFDAIIVLIDYHGTIQRVNETAVSEFGYGPKEELEGESVSGGGEAERHYMHFERYRKSGGTSSIIGNQRVVKSKRAGEDHEQIVG